ncbi:MAG: hypothetical protein OXC26_23075 [Albidovulum sp.]|nr:hypothetical protein [Albidovulum sp.]
MLFAVRNLRASRVNLLMNDFAAGLPSPLSFLGLADALARDLGLAAWSARVLPVLHRVSVTEGRTKPEMKIKSGDFVPDETMEDLTGTVEVSILVDLPGWDSEAGLQVAMIGRRIAGGTLQDDGCVVEALARDGSAFRKMRRGYAMVRPELPERLQITTGDEDQLAEMASILFPAKRPRGFGWIVPVSVGYRLLERPDEAPKRIRTRCGTVPHVFAEPVLGIAELISVRSSRLLELTEETLHAILWRWEVRGDHILGHAAYHPESNKKEDCYHV